MIKIENVEVFNFEGAIRGMRNPKNSWDRSDSCYEHLGYPLENKYGDAIGWCESEITEFKIGKNDLALMQRLYKAGTEHRKYLRQIFVSMDITAPHYFWHDFDTYRIGVSKNSCSKMHRIQGKEFTFDDFSHEHLPDLIDPVDSPMAVLEHIVFCLNRAREKYLKTGDKQYWWQMIQLLPLSYNQKATVTMNYENVFNIIRQRENHKLDEFRKLCEELKKLPYVKEIMEIKEE